MGRLLLIGFAGLVGTLGRYCLAGVFGRRFGESFPIGTIVINVVGCFLAGFLFYVLQERNLVSETVRLAIIVGFLGGFTTFSAFGLHFYTLPRWRDVPRIGEFNCDERDGSVFCLGWILTRARRRELNLSPGFLTFTSETNSAFSTAGSTLPVFSGRPEFPEADYRHERSTVIMRQER